MSKDFSIIRGDDKDLKFTIKNSDGQAFSIVGYTVFFTVKASLTLSDEAAVISKEKISSASGDPDDDGLNGKILISLSNEDTDIATQLYYYDIQLVSPTGKVSSSPSARLRIIQDVSRTS